MTDFGTSIDGFDDLPPRFGVVSGWANLRNHLYRRLTTPAGSLPWDTSVGYDLRSLINARATAQTISIAEQEIARECEKDERITSASATVTYTAATGAVTVSITAQTADGPFELVLGVGAVTVDILRSTAA